MSDYFDVRDRMRSLYIAEPVKAVEGARAEPLDGGFLTEVAGRVVLTAPAHQLRVADELPPELAESWEKASSHNPFMLWLQGRFVEAEQANRNGAYWSTADLQFGQMSVRHGPLNWLHEETNVIGTIADNALIQPETPAEPDQLTKLQLALFEDGTYTTNTANLQWGPSRMPKTAAGQGLTTTEEARTFTTEQRRKLAGGAAMPDGSFPIQNAEDLKNAIGLVGNAKDPAKARAHVIKRARALGLTTLLPDSWKKETSAAARPYIAAVSSVWRWINPQRAAVIEAAAETGKLFYSMECVAEKIECASDGDRTGCGRAFDYMQAMADPTSTCEHIASRSSARRMVNPFFLGGAAIVPPVQPGWANAKVDLLQAASLAEQAWTPSLDVQDEAWLSLMAEVIRFSQS